MGNISNYVVDNYIVFVVSFLYFVYLFFYLYQVSHNKDFSIKRFLRLNNSSDSDDNAEIDYEKKVFNTFINRLPLLVLYLIVLGNTIGSMIIIHLLDETFFKKYLLISIIIISVSLALSLILAFIGFRKEKRNFNDSYYDNVSSKICFFLNYIELYFTILSIFIFIVIAIHSTTLFYS